MLTRVLLQGHLWVFSITLPLFDRLLGIKPLLKLVTPPRWLTPYRRVDIKTILALVNGHMDEARHMKRRRCLRHGLTFFHFLCLAGHNPTLVFGVFPWQEGRRGLAHCWVVLDGKELTERPKETFAEILRHTRG